VQKSQTNTRLLNNSPTRINILNKCDKKVLGVYIGPREIVYGRLPVAANEGPGSFLKIVVKQIFSSATPFFRIELMYLLRYFILGRM
jgi:hypothetical protein